MESRKRKRLLLAFAGVVAFVAGFWLVLNRNAEPTYKGRPLSEWVTRFSLGQGSDRDTAAVALRGIGTNALPWLMKWTAAGAGPFRLKAESLAEELAPQLPNRLASSLVRFSHDRNGKAEGAALSFLALGSLAAPAIPELERRLFQNPPDRYHDRAAFAVGAIGVAAVPVLTNAFARRFAAADQNCLRYLGNLGTNFVLVLPIVMAGCRDPDPVRAMQSVEILGQFYVAYGDQAIPLLVNCLSDPRGEIRVRAARVIGHFGHSATVALPALNNALHDTEAVVRIQARATVEALTMTNAVLDYFQR